MKQRVAGLLSAALISLPAGFAPGSLWLSSTSLTSGDNATLYTVVYNSSNQAVSGSVVFNVDGQSFSTSSVTLGTGQTQIVSEPWTATAGTHTFAAYIENAQAGNGTDAATFLNTSTGSTTVTVANPPPQPMAAASASVSSTLTTLAGTSTLAAIASSSPIAQSLVGDAEAVRQSAITALTALASSTQTATSSASATSTPAGQVLGVQDYEPNGSLSVASVSSGGAHSFLELLLTICASPLWFYLLVLVILCLIVLFLRTLMTERHRNRRARK